MRLYHGTAAWTEIRRDGLDPAPDIKTFDEDELGLESLGGIYLSDSVDAAGFYAVKSVNSNGWTLGLDPCFFAVEVPEESLLPDEDKIAAAVSDVAGVYSNCNRWDAEACLKALASRRGEFLADLKDALRLPLTEDDGKIWAGVEAIVIRQAEDGWPEGGTEAVDWLCRAARGTLDHEWLTRLFDGQYWFTCRTLEQIPPSRIVGGVRLAISSDGLAITAVETFGEVMPDEVADFKEAAIKNFRDIQSVEITDETERSPAFA